MEGENLSLLINYRRRKRSRALEGIKRRSNNLKSMSQLKESRRIDGRSWVVTRRITHFIV